MIIKKQQEVTNKVLSALRKGGLPKEEGTCKGRFYRYTESAYRAKDGSIQTKQTFRLLKRASCKGCSKCAWIEDDITETLSSEGEVFMYDSFTDGDTAYWYMDGYHDYEYGWQCMDSGFKKSEKSL